MPTAADLPTLVASAAFGTRHGALLAGTLVAPAIVNRTAYRVRALYGNPVDG